MKYGRGKNPNSRNGFKKGHPVSDELRQKMRERNLRIGLKPPSQKGVKYSDEYKKKMSKVAKERGFGQWMLGKTLSEETRKNCSEAQMRVIAEGRHNFYRGGKDSNWQGGKTELSKRIRTSPEYKWWRKQVYKRDGFKCIFCGSNERIEADHIKPFCDYVELRFAIENGRTLCRKCHTKTDSYGHNSKLKKKDVD